MEKIPIIISSTITFKSHVIKQINGKKNLKWKIVHYFVSLQTVSEITFDLSAKIHILITEDS